MDIDTLVKNAEQLNIKNQKRSWFNGASPIDVFDNDSIDTISVRKEFEI